MKLSKKKYGTKFCLKLFFVNHPSTRYVKYNVPHFAFSKFLNGLRSTPQPSLELKRVESPITR